jgi:Skp family chaperone for outer membrane proteins
MTVAEVGTARAEDAAPQPLRIAVVDFGAVRRDAAAAQAIRTQMERYVVSYQSDIEKEELELRDAQQQLDQKRAGLSADAYSVELRKWEEAVSEAQRRFLKRRQDMERARADAWQRVNQQVDQIIKTIAIERNLDIIIRRDQAVHVLPRLEITEEVLRRLDRDMPSAQVLVPHDS